MENKKAILVVKPIQNQARKTLVFYSQSFTFQHLFADWRGPVFICFHACKNWLFLGHALSRTSRCSVPQQLVFCLIRVVRLPQLWQRNASEALRSFVKINRSFQRKVLRTTLGFLGGELQINMPGLSVPKCEIGKKTSGP